MIWRPQEYKKKQCVCWLDKRGSKMSTRTQIFYQVNKANMAGKMEFIEEYLRSCCDVVRAPLAYVIRKAITVQTYVSNPKQATPDDEVITRMLHLPPDKNKLNNTKSAQLVKECMTE